MAQFQELQTTTSKKQFDTVIVGAGSAGLVSALALTEAGKQVVVLEKMAKPGGNSIRASSGMNAAKTAVQEYAGIKDTYEAFFEDTYRSGGQQNDVDMLRYFTSHAAEAVDWLKNHGIILDDLTLTGGMAVKRAHRPGSAPAIGGYLIHHLIDDLAEKQVPVVCETKVVNIIRTEAGDFEVVTENPAGIRETLHSKTIILATGGFSASQDLIGHYRPDLLHYRTTGLVDDFATGPFAAIPVAPAVHYTMGGLKVNVQTQVLDDQQQPIAGLYAAGETVGGLHGNNRLGGNSIAETVVFGLAAARQIRNYQS
ncbi:FAD-dependent oxidoreductase [Pediococcus acidilactici]